MNSSRNIILKEGWEKFWSKEQQKYYYHHAAKNVTTWDASAATANTESFAVVEYSEDQRDFFAVWQEAMRHAGIDAERIDAYASRLAKANVGPEKFSGALTQDFLNELGINDSQDVSKLLRFQKLSLNLDKELFGEEESKSSRNQNDQKLSNWKELVDESSGETIPLHRRGNLYVMRAWIRQDKSSDFGRPQ